MAETLKGVLCKTKNQDIEHFMKMYSICNKRVISIMSNHWRTSNNKKETVFREFLQDNNAQIIDIDAGEFKESGTNVASCLVVLDIV